MTAVGDRVVIHIHAPETWVKRAVSVLNNKTGVVKEINPMYMFPCRGIVSGPPVPGYLVEFDTDAKPWHSYSGMIRAFWFEALDLLPESEPHKYGPAKTRAESEAEGVPEAQLERVYGKK